MDTEPTVREIQSQAITNQTKKRKLDDCNTDNITNEPDRKKRKLTEPNISNKLLESHQLLQHQNQSLTQANKQLRKASSQLKQGINICKTETIKWKSKYNKLLSRLSMAIDTQSNTQSPPKHPIMCKNNNNTNNKNEITNKYISIRDRLFQMGFDKESITTRLIPYNNSDKLPELVFNELINSFTNETSNETYTPKKRLRSHNKSMKSKTDYTNNNSNEFEDSYYVSADCHICSAHFNNMSSYKSHLKQHYDNNMNKIWLKCDFNECNQKKFRDSVKFIGHISRHLNIEPYKCNVVNNGIKCIASNRYKHGMKEHWKSHHRLPSNTNNKKIKPKFRSTPIAKCNDNKLIAFEDSYYIFVDCHICKKHFNNFYKYETHIESHYINDPHRIWRQCDFGCEINPKRPLFKDNKYFISHISQHTNQKPFKCNIITKGIKCHTSCGSKNNLKRHWRESHFKSQKFNRNKTQKINRNKVQKNKKKLTKNSDRFRKQQHVNVNVNVSDVRVETDGNHSKNNGSKMKHSEPVDNASKIIKNKITNFEQSYRISVPCHICKKHFNTLDSYKFHLKQHYDSDHLRTWLKCEMCKDRIFHSFTQFIAHIASHTKHYPFKCNGNKCDFAAQTKSNFKRHWNSKHAEDMCQNNTKKYECEESDYSSEEFSEYESESSEVDEYSKSVSDGGDDGDEFEENGYFVSVNCHICKGHFSDYTKYKEHMQKHYLEDKGRVWLECDFGCKEGEDEGGDGNAKKLRDVQAFLCHIASHTMCYPFKCKLCKKGAGTKSNIKKHWNSCGSRKDKGNDGSGFSESESYESDSESEENREYVYKTRNKSKAQQKGNDAK